MNEILQKIENLISENKVVLFMKGTAQQPQCGFSATVAQILKVLGVDFKDINVLEDEELREAIKQFSDWPTVPQLYINREFIGGCDIVKEAYKTGELEELLGKA